MESPRERVTPPSLPNPSPRRGPRRPSTPEKVRDVFGNRKDLDFTQNAGFHGGPSARRKGYKLAAWSWLASAIDALVLVAASCAFLLVFSQIVHSPLLKIVRTISLTQSQTLLFIEVFAFLTWVYLVVARSFLGFSVGEWVCDLRLGQPLERLRASYVLRVAFRSTLILGTGVFTLPLLSLILGRDIAGSLSGLRLFSLK